uniref:Uncharacterized protein n=1 Tax=Anguilla anguilla TaxID=7936 RepID=A0A0E9S9S2_ANGAN
MSRLRLETRR